jgi:hypothetical protein
MSTGNPTGSPVPKEFGDKASEGQGSFGQGAAPSRSRRWAYFLLRFSLGINMFVDGTGWLYQGLQGWVATTEKLFIGNILPMWLAHRFLTLLPFMEAAIGVLLLILGPWTHWALIWEGIVMIILAFGMGCGRTSSFKRRLTTLQPWSPSRWSTCSPFTFCW